MRNTTLRHTILLVFLTLFTVFQQATAREKGDAPFLETRLSRDKMVAGETAVYEVVLFTPVSQIEGVEAMAYPNFEGADVSRSSADNRLTPVDINGRQYYTAVIDRYFLRYPENGKFKISGGQYRLGLLHRQEFYDPFWGRQYGNVVDAITVQAPETGVKVISLPQKGRPADFSGAVGDFEIEVEFPDGELRSGDDTRMILSISGIGSLDGVKMPDIPAMLPEGLQFKSMTDNINHFVKDGELGSEVEIECVVMPKKEGSFTIDGIAFNYFNSKTGKYDVIVAPVVEIVVKEGLPGSGKPTVIMEI